MGTFNPETGFVSEGYVSQSEHAALQYELSQLKEDWDQAAAALLRLRAEDKGWNLIGNVGADREGFTLDVTQKIAKNTALQCVGNPLLTRGFRYRFNTIFGKGFTVQGDLKPRHQRILDRTTIHDLLFTSDGRESMEKALYTTGNLFVILDKTTNDLIRIPLSQITRRAADPIDQTRTAYYLWTHDVVDFDGTTYTVNEWIPVTEWAQDGRVQEVEIANHPVNPNYEVIDLRVNVPTEGHWGVPDSFAALPYTWAYAEYIRDAASLLKALQMIAWKVVGKSKPQAQAAGVRLSDTRRVGGVAAMTQDTELAAMPRAGQVDMNDGLALAAMAASALEVPVAALLTNSQVAGSAAAVPSLDKTTVDMAIARQTKWIHFYQRVFRALGMAGLTINFPKITEDPVHRQVSSLATGRATGAIHADEYRAAFLEATDVVPLHDNAPDVEEYAQAQNALGFMQLVMGLNAPEAESDPLSRQGNSGVSGRLGEIDNTNRNMDSAAGNGSQTDLVG